jgi:hypothetical protein
MPSVRHFLVRLAGIEPARCHHRGIFVPATAFAAKLALVWGLDYTFTVAFAVGARRLVSTPSLVGSCRAWLGITSSAFHAG